MKRPVQKPPCEDVLDAFAVEFNPDFKTLEKYVREYPEYERELQQLAQELSREVIEDDSPLSVKEQALITKTWKKYKQAFTVPVDVLAALPVSKQRELSKLLDVPRQIILAFKERRVLASSVPQRFLKTMASELHTQVHLLVALLEKPPEASLSRSYKSDEKPETKERVTFERLLIDANVSVEKRAKLLAEDD